MLGKGKSEKSCEPEAKNEEGKKKNFPLMHPEIWEDSLNLVKKSSNVSLSAWLRRDFGSHLVDSTPCFLDGCALQAGGEI